MAQPALIGSVFTELLDAAVEAGLWTKDPDGRLRPVDKGGTFVLSFPMPVVEYDLCPARLPRPRPISNPGNDSEKAA